MQKEKGADLTGKKNTISLMYTYILFIGAFRLQKI